MKKKQLIIIISAFLMASILIITVYKLTPKMKQSYSDINVEDVVDLTETITASSENGKTSKIDSITIDEVNYTILSAQIESDSIDDFLWVTMQIENLTDNTKTLSLGNHRIKILSEYIEPCYLNDKQNKINRQDYWHFDLKSKENCKIKLCYEISEEYTDETVYFILSPKGNGLAGITDSAGNLQYVTSEDTYEIDLTKLLGEVNEKNTEN